MIPTRARRPFDASVDPTDARNDILGCVGRSDRRATATPVFETGSERADSREIKAFSSHQEPLAPDLLHDTCQTDPDLARIVDAWPTLPEAVRAGIVAMVKAALPDPS